MAKPKKVYSGNIGGPYQSSIKPNTRRKMTTSKAKKGK